MNVRTKKSLKTVIVISILGVLGLFSASELCGIGMCTFVPLTWPVIFRSSLVAAGTIFVAFILDISWRIPPTIYSLPMLLPAILAATAMSEEWPRFLIALVCIGTSWTGSYFLGYHRQIL